MGKIQTKTTASVYTRRLLVALGLVGFTGLISAQDSLGSQQRTEKISELEGGFGGTLEVGEGFGTVTVTVGDVDEDGNDDIAVASTNTVWLLFLNADGTVKDETEIFTLPFSLASTSAPAGLSLAPVGDLNGDAVVDLAVGDPGSSSEGPGRGSVTILFLGADGAVKSRARITDPEAGFHGELRDFDAFGASIVALPTTTPGAARDLAIGATGDDEAAEDAGALWLLSLAPDATVINQLKTLPPTSDAEGILPGGGFPSSIALIDDIDGNGVDDLAIGAEGDDDGADDAGAAFIFFRDGLFGFIGEQKISNLEGGLGNVLAAGDNFGSGIATLGDLDEDGVGDIAVGARGTDDGGTDLGGVWLLFLNSDGTVRDALELSDDDPGFGGLLAEGDGFGTSLSFIEDLDGNGLPELTVGTPGDDDGGENKGAVYIVFFQFPAEMVNEGSGINPLVFQPGINPPQIGSVWDPIVELETPESALGGANFFVIGISSRRQSPTFLSTATAGGIVIEGELLISIQPGDLQITQAVDPGQRFAIPVPNNVDLIGLECYAQSVIAFTGLLQLTNGLDVIIGFPPTD